MIARLHLSGLTIGALLLSALPATAQRFGPTPVTGVKVLAGNPKPVTLLENRTFLSSASLCSNIRQRKPLIDKAIGDAVGRVNQAIARQIKGISLVRYELVLSPSCSAVVDGATVGNPQGGLIAQLKLPSTKFITNITTPDINIFGAGLGLPQGADPRLAVEFDLEVSVRIAVPHTLGDRLKAGTATATFSNIRHPAGLNFTGKLVGDLAKATATIYDHFNNGEIAGLMSRGQTFTETVPDSVLDPVNKALDPYRGKLQLVEVRVDPQALLVLHATDGKKVANPECISGYVWRSIRAGDQVCVTAATRSQAQADNKAAGERRVSEPAKAALAACTAAIRPDPACTAKAYRIACKPGFVWREAFADDYVCVTPATRDLARADNAAAPRRRMDYEAVVR